MGEGGTPRTSSWEWQCFGAACQEGVDFVKRWRAVWARDGVRTGPFASMFCVVWATLVEAGGRLGQVLTMDVCTPGGRRPTGETSSVVFPLPPPSRKMACRRDAGEEK